MQITTARPDEIAEVWDLIDTAFNFAPYPFRERLPWQWLPECIDWDGVFVVRDENGQLSSLVRLWEMHLVQNGKSMVCGGIGSVSTSAAARGKGGMSALMEHCGQEMKRRGYPFGVLGGDRFRYASFGYESAGRAMNISIDGRGLRRCGIEPIESVPFDQGVLDRIEATRAKTAWTVRRRPCETKHMYRTATRHVLSAGNGDDFGFLVFEGERTWEWGGHPITVLRLAAYAIQSEMMKRFNLSMSHGAPVPDVFHRAMANWSVTPAFRAVIYDLEKTLHAFDAQQYGPELVNLDPCEQVWHLWGKPDAPRNLWFFPIDLV